MKNKIISLEIIRAISFLLIFIRHSNTLSNYAYSFGALGVLTFYILSGFLMVYNYNYKNLDCNIKVNFLFALKKIKKLYFLYVLIIILNFIYLMFINIYTNTFNLTLFLNNIKYILLDCCFLQIFFPKLDYYTFTAIWFYATLFYLYFCFPYILKFIKKYVNNNNIYIYFFLIILFQLFMYYIAPKTYSFAFEDWLVYYTPFYRIFDFSLGCLLGYLFINKKERNLSNNNILLPILSILLWITSAFICNFNNPLTPIILGLPVLFLIYIFALYNDCFSNLKSIKFILYIAYISPYAYLIHSLCITITTLILSHFLDVKLISDLVAFIITIILSQLYINVLNKYNNKT